MIATALGDLDCATRLFVAAAAQRARTGGAVWLLTLADREHALAAASAGLGEVPFEAAWHAGRDLSLAHSIGESRALAGAAGAVRRDAADGVRHARSRGGGRRK